MTERETYMKHYPLSIVQQIYDERQGRDDKESRSIFRTVERELRIRKKHPADEPQLRIELDA
jgi:hypothetical protein